MLCYPVSDFTHEMSIIHAEHSKKLANLTGTFQQKYKETEW